MLQIRRSKPQLSSGLLNAADMAKRAADKKAAADALAAKKVSEKA